MKFYFLWRPPDVLATKSLVFYLLIHQFVCSFHYDIGDYAVGCPEGWLSVGDRCFYVIDDNVYRWSEASIKCAQVKSVNSRVLHNDNWFLIRDLSLALQDLKIPSFQFWTGFYVELDESGSLPATIKQTDSSSEVPMYNPIWNELQPQLSMLFNSTKLCLIIDSKIDDRTKYGWKLKDCDESYAILCETFTCLQSSYRCKDNSACIPQSAVCDGVVDCQDQDDELNCNCDCDKLQTTFNNTYGSIRNWGSKSNSCPSTYCSWEIVQTPGTRIRLNLMSIGNNDLGYVKVEGLDSGEIYTIGSNGPASIQTSGSHLRVQYVNNSTQSIGSFHLQYIGEESTSCVQRFESWNGTFSPPMHIHQRDRYRSSTNCKWIIDNKERQPLSVQIPLFKLAIGDYLLIYDGEIDRTNLLGNFSSLNKPPSSFVSLQPEVTFQFYASPKTVGDLGFLVVFERTCVNQLIKQGHGQIQSPGFHQPSHRLPFECSWFVDAPCSSNSCGLTVYFDALNFTNMDQIVLHSANEELILDGSSLPISFRSTLPQLQITIRGLSKQFAALLTFSGDCPIDEIQNALPQVSSKSSVVFRDRAQFVCQNPTKQAQFFATCSLSGQWSLSDPSTCQKAQASATCIVKKIANGWATSVDRENGELIYECERGFLPKQPTKVECKNGNWTPAPKCEEIKCGPLESEPLSTPSPGSGYMSAVPTESATSFPVYKNVTYDCINKENYEIRGNANYRLCLEDGQWTMPEIYCQEMKCGLNQVIEHSDNKLYEMALNDVRTLTCIHGFNSSIRNAKDQFSCVKVDPSVFSPPIADIRCEKYDFCSNTSLCRHGQCEPLYNDFYCNCNPGFEMQDGECVDIDECKLGIDDCANAICLKHTSGYDCQCKSNYIQVNEDVAFSDRSKLIQNITCIESRCPIPFVEVKNQIIITDDPIYRTNTNISIYESGVIGPVEKRFCQNNNEWHVEAETRLQVVSCPIIDVEPAVLKDVNESAIPLYQLVRFECVDSTYELIGPKEAICLQSGQLNIQKSPLCLKPQCNNIDVTSYRALHINVTSSYTITNQSFSIGTKINFYCDPGHILSGISNFTCENINNIPMWYPTDQKIPFCIINSTMLKNTENTCALQLDDDILPSSYILEVGESASFKCQQPNYALSHNEPSVCKRHVEREKRAVNCISKWNSTTEAIVGSVMQLYCELSPFCSNMHLTWRNERRRNLLNNVAFVAGDLGPGIIATINPTLRSDEGPYICEARDNHDNLIDIARTFIKLTSEKISTSWREVLSNAIPSKFRIFDSKNIKAGWNHSVHWNQLSDGNFQFTPFSGTRDWLTSPMIQVDAKWVEVTAEIGQCNDCSISLNYFSASTQLEKLRLEQFVPLGAATPGPLSHTIQFLLPYSLAWLMIIVDTKGKPMRLDRLALSAMSCSNVRLGNTVFPETLVLSTNVSVNGICELHPASSSSSQLICSPQGRWYAINNQEPSSACDCNSGYIFVNGKCTRKGIECFECETAAPDECRSHLRTCDVDERCSSQIWRQSNGELLIRKSCEKNCVPRFDNYEKCRNGEEVFCELCCETDSCNNEHPVAQVTSTATSLITRPSIPITDLNYLDPPPPFCIDQQPLQLSCVDTIQVVRSSDGFKPTTVPWPTIIDNDPNVRLEVNLPGLGHQPYAFDGTEQEIRWSAIDKHGTRVECVTNVMFQNSNVPEIQCPEHHYVDPIFNTASPEVPINLPKIVVSDNSNTQIVYEPQNGTFIPMGKPIQVKVTVVDGRGTLAHCQYTAEAADCPLWRVDGSRYACRRESTSISICYPRSQCTTREIPPDVKALVCVPGHGWRLLDGGIDVMVKNLSDATPMRTSPVCLQETSSAVTLSLTFTHGLLNPECSREFSQQMTILLSNFLNENCQEVLWSLSSASQIDQGQKLLLNYTTQMSDTQDVLNCIKDVTNRIPIKNLLCIRRTVFTSVLYHLKCPSGWGANRNLKCEKCPAGYQVQEDACTPCDLGFYSTTESLKCVSCPIGTTTQFEGSTSVHECLEYCPIGFYSSNGLAPCNRCSEGTTTVATGSSSISQCITIDCQVSQCKNGGTCVNQRCQCPEGTSGKLCENLGSQTTRTKRKVVKRNVNNRSTAVTLSSTLPTMTITRAQNATSTLTPDTLSNVTATYSTQTSRQTSTTRHFTPRTTQKRSVSTSLTTISTTFSTFIVCEMNSCPNGRCKAGQNETGSLCSCDQGFNYNAETSKCEPESLCDWNICDSQHTKHNSTDPNNCCVCIDGWTGAFCEKQIGCCTSTFECILYGENQESMCVFENATSECGTCYYKCHGAYWQKQCGDSSRMPDKFNCEHKDCNSHGNCTLDSKGIPYCNCQDDYVGENCEKKISRCSPNSKEPLSCERGGRCRQQDDLEYCECVAGSTGTNCETSLHECRWDSCKNNAQCETLVDGVYCSCSPGYFGERCEKAVDPCEVRGAVCGNGKCVANAEGYDGDYTCECAPGYDPLTNCLSPLDPCINNKCQSGSICQPTGVNSYVCLCADGMQGEFCDTEIVYCIKGICLNGGTCTQYLSEDNTLQFRCDCPKDVKGTNCEILPDPCASFQCQHNGYCIVLQSGEPYCKCKDNYSGAHCEKPPSLCDDPNYCNSGECIRAKDGYDYCNCPVETTGLRCETQKSDNYNFHFTGIKSKQKQQIRSQVLKDYTFSTALTLSSWIKYGTDGTQQHKPSNSDSVMIAIQHSDDEMNWKTIVWFSNNGISYSYSQLVDYVVEKNAWHHIAMEFNFDNKNFAFRVDGQIVKNQSFTSFNQGGNYQVVLGENLDGQQEFIGEISLVQMFDRTFSNEEYSEMVVDCPSFVDHQIPELMVPWSGYTTIDQYNDAVFSVYPGICVSSVCLPGHADCSADRDKIPPTVLQCPFTQNIVSDNRLTTVEWDDDPQKMFEDNDMVVSVDSNFRSGQIFIWGLYHVVYVAKDRSGNTAICEFDVAISPQDCKPQVSTDSVVVNVTDFNQKQAKQLSVVSCSQNDFVFTQELPPFYVCDLMGRWDRFAIMGTRFNLPSCSSTVNPLQLVNGTMDITNCSYVADVRKKLHDAIVNAGFCKNPDCVGELIITDSCTGTLRFRRETNEFTSTTFIVSYQLNVTSTPYAVKPVLEEKFNSTFGSNSPDVNTRFDCSQNDHPQLHHSPHNTDETKDLYQCASCPAGQFYDETANKCEFCRINTYKSSEGVGNCVDCPVNTITGNKTGSIDEADCFLNCHSGSFFNVVDNDCKECPLGTYMPDSGRLKCTACPVQFTTKTTGSKSIDDCNVRCNPGFELDVSEACIACPQNTFRSEEMSACRKCDRGFETQTVGSAAASDCNVVYCPIGFATKPNLGAVNQENAKFEDVCEQCAIGYYQANEGQSICERCPTGYTTKQKGSISEDYCTINGGLICTPTHADFCPPGTECVQVTSGGYECRELSTTSLPVRHPLPPWIWILIVCVGMICFLVIAFLLIIHRERLLQFCDEHFPGLLCCWKLKEGGRRFSLNPTRDTTALPFTPTDLPSRNPQTNHSSMQMNENGADLWSNLSSERTSRRSENDAHPRSIDYSHPDDPTALNSDRNTLDEIRSEFLNMENGSDGSTKSTTPPPLAPNPLRVETRPPFVGLTHRRSLTRHGPYGQMNSAEITTKTHETGDIYERRKFAAQINSNGQSFAWSRQAERKSPGTLGNNMGSQSVNLPTRLSTSTSRPKPSNHEDDDNDFFC